MVGGTKTMKVIKYGNSNEPKRVTCKHCKSIIEYLDTEVKRDCFYEGVSDDVYATPKQQDLYFVEEYSIKCPVCRKTIVVYERRACFYRH
jgi:ribosomal protein S27E